MKIYEHPKCELRYCSQALIYDDYANYLSCKIAPYLWEHAKEKYSLTEDEAISICMITFDAVGISNTLLKGNSGLYGCYLDYFNKAFNKIWLYSKKYEMMTFEYLYHGVGLERAKTYKLIDGAQCKLKKGKYLTFSSYTSTTTKWTRARDFANRKSGGMVITIKTLKYKTKGVPIDSLSVWRGEAELIFPPGSKFQIISDCKKKVLDTSQVLYEVEVKEIGELEDLDEYETQTIDPNENKINIYTQICTKCNKEVHNNCKYCNIPEKCSECYAGFVLDGSGKCVKCKNNCLTCDDSKCTSCLYGFGNINGECKICQVTNCLNCDENVKKCQKCKKGYEIKIDDSGNIKCFKSDTWCKTYNKKGECQECFGGSYLENLKCIECEIEGCLKCSKDESGNKKCTQCVPGYGLENWQCEKCETGCQDCKEKKCINCNYEYTLNQFGECIPCTQKCKECKLENGEIKCTKCFEGYFLVNDECNRCTNSASCSECKDSIDTCSSCTSSSILNINNKCEDCGELCSECMFNQDKKKECLYCFNSNFMDANKKCQKCPDNCQKCEETNKCLACRFPYYFLNSEGKCEECQNLIKGCDKCDYNAKGELECSECDSSYTLTNGKCEICEKDNCKFL